MGGAQITAMLYCLYGKDTDAVRTKTQALVAALLKKQPDSEVFTLTDETFTVATLQEYVGSQGLFSQKYIVVVAGVLANKEKRDELLGALQALKESPHVCIIREDALTKEVLNKITKYAEKVQEFGETEVKKKKETGLFDLCDALGERDKKGLWVLYQKAKRDGAEDEQIHGMLWWQIKAMVAAVKAGSVEASGLSPFVYGKAVRYAKNFSADELRDLATECVRISHEARRGGDNLGTALERMILII